MLAIRKRLDLVDIDSRIARPSRAQGRLKRARLDQPRPAGVDERRGRLHQGEIGGGDDIARRRHEAHVQRQEIAFTEKRFLVGRGCIAIGSRLRPRGFA